ncbi:MAG: DUF6428 family protein [Crocinitomicaceae bacterium]
MKLSDFKTKLVGMEQISFRLPNGTLVPAHFHVTEVGSVTKHFIDCGGTIREEKRVNFQLWEANDYDHRLHPEKLVSIIQLSEDKLGLTDEEIEVEYQGDTIGKYGLEVEGNQFVLTSLTTDCLAKDNCGIPTEKLKVSLSTLGNDSAACCTPGGGCC